MNDRQKIFVAKYLLCMNATQAAINAGYSPRTAYSQGQRLLKHVEVKAAIDNAMTEKNNSLIATRKALQEFWTATMLDDTQDMKHRLKASELLARSQADFTEHHDITAV